MGIFIFLAAFAVVALAGWGHLCAEPSSRRRARHPDLSLQGQTASKTDTKERSLGYASEAIVLFSWRLQLGPGRSRWFQPRVGW